MFVRFVILLDRFISTCFNDIKLFNRRKTIIYIENFIIPPPKKW